MRLITQMLGQTLHDFSYPFHPVYDIYWTNSTSNRMGIISEAGTENFSGAPEFITVFDGFPVKYCIECTIYL
jgi:hypothetical protein